MLSSTFRLTLVLILSSVLISTTTAVLDQCTLSLAGLVADPGLKQCLPIPALSQLLTAPITPTLINNTATQFCSFPVCSPASVKLVENTVAQNCVNASADQSTAQLVSGAASLYVPFKQGLCQRVPEPNNGTFCITVLTDTMTAYLAKHPSPLGLKIFANSVVLKQYVNEMPKELLCTPCNKAIINPLTNHIATNQKTLNAEVLRWANVIQTEVQAKCGAGFTDGAPPSPQGQDTNQGLVSVESSLFLVALTALVSVGASLL